MYLTTVGAEEVFFSVSSLGAVTAGAHRQNQHLLLIESLLRRFSVNCWIVVVVEKL